MKDKVRRKLYWRRLDDQAKVFSLANNSKYNPTFRLSVVLKEKIEEKILQISLELALEKYKAFKVKMRKGLFWHYFVENENKPVISVESEYPFSKINTKENNEYLFKVTYFENKINIDFLHILTDGNSGVEFFKEIIYRYLEFKHPEKLERIKLQGEHVVKDSENAYKKNYKKAVKIISLTKKAYMIKGKKLSNGKFGIDHFNINLKEIKECTKPRGCSLSMYLVAMIAYSIYETSYKTNKSKKPINICVPVNLKKYFVTETVSNFFSYITISLNLKKYFRYSFENILDMVKKEFEKKLKIEKIVETMSSDAGITNNILVRVVPLVVKRLVVRIGALEVKRRLTMSVSNIGKIEIDNKYTKYIENFFVILAPDWAEKVKCGVCSYGDNLVVTFCTMLNDNSIESKFRDLLKKENINFKIEGNGVNVISN